MGVEESVASRFATSAGSFFSWRAWRPGGSIQDFVGVHRRSTLTPAPLSWAVAMLVLLAGPAFGAEDAAQRALQQNQLGRQQQQDQLQLKMQQYQRNTQTPPADARQRQAIEQLELNQQLRQQQLHQQQQRELQARPESPADDEGTRRAKAQIEQQRARQESRRQLQQFDRERQADSKKPPDERFVLPGAENPDSGSLRLAP